MQRTRWRTPTRSARLRQLDGLPRVRGLVVSPALADPHKGQGPPTHGERVDGPSQATYPSALAFVLLDAVEPRNVDCRAGRVDSPNARPYHVRAWPFTGPHNGGNMCESRSNIHFRIGSATSNPARTAPIVSDSRDSAPTLPLDETIADLSAWAVSHPVPLALATGVFGSAVAAAMRLSLAAGSPAAAELLASFAFGIGLSRGLACAAHVATPESARAVRRSAYATGVIKPRPRATAADRLRAELAAWGLDRKAVA